MSGAGTDTEMLFARVINAMPAFPRRTTERPAGYRISDNADLGPKSGLIIAATLRS